MDAAMDSFDDSDAISGPGGREDDGGRGARGGLDEEGMMEEGVDLRLMGQLVPRFLGKVTGVVWGVCGWVCLVVVVVVDTHTSICMYP
jgi:hypothetical protein